MNDGYPSKSPQSRASLLAKITGATVLAAGAMLYGNGTSQVQTLAAETAGRVLVSAGAAAPVWTDIYGQANVWTAAQTINVTGNAILSVTGTAAAQVNITGALASTQLSMTGGSITGLGYFSGSQFNFGTFTSNALTLITGNAVRATLDTSGNLGVGVAPSYTLDVYSAASNAVQMSGTSTNTNRSLASYDGLRVRNRSTTDGNMFSIINLDGNGVPNAQLNFVNVAHTGTKGAISFVTRTGGTWAERALLDENGNLGIGVVPTAGNGLLQLASGTTKANGIAFGTDAFLYRVAANQIDFGGAAGVDLTLNIRRSTGENIILKSGFGATQIGSASAHQVQIIAGGLACGVVKTTGQIRFLPLSSDPAGAETGDVYYNSTTNKLRVYNGAWVDLH